LEGEKKFVAALPLLGQAIELTSSVASPDERFDRLGHDTSKNGKFAEKPCQVFFAVNSIFF
jgi:hypothetical protein